MAARRQESLRRYLLCLCGCRHTADDLAQEAFLKAYMRLHTFRNEAKASTWLFAIARNLFYDYVKSRNRRGFAVSIDDAAAHAAADDEPAPDIDQQLWAALGMLKDEERHIVLLHYMERQSVRRISAIMGMPQGSVKSHLHRARQRLRMLLEGGA